MDAVQFATVYTRGKKIDWKRAEEKYFDFGLIACLIDEAHYDCILLSSRSAGVFVYATYTTWLHVTRKFIKYRN